MDRHHAAGQAGSTPPEVVGQLVGEPVEDLAAVGGSLASETEGAREGLLVVEHGVHVGELTLEVGDEGAAVVAEPRVVVEVALGVESYSHNLSTISSGEMSMQRRSPRRQGLAP